MLDLNKLLSTWAIWMMLNTETINTKAAYFQMRCSLQIYEEPRWSYAFVEFTDKIDIGFSVCLPVICTHCTICKSRPGIGVDSQYCAEETKEISSIPFFFFSYLTKFFLFTPKL